MSIDGAFYEVEGNLAGEEVLLWWGLFDHELFVEWNDKRYGPYRPEGGPIPLHRYRKRRSSPREKRAEAVAKLAEQINLPRTAVAGLGVDITSAEVVPLPKVKFSDPDPWGQIAYENELSARRAISYLLDRPLAELSQEDRAFVGDLVGRTLNKTEIEAAIKQRFQRGQ